MIEYCTSNDCCLYWNEAIYFSRERNRLVLTTNLNFIVIFTASCAFGQSVEKVFVSARCNSWPRERYKNSIKCTSKILRICAKYRGNTRAVTVVTLAVIRNPYSSTADINLKHTRYQRIDYGQITIITCIADSTCACRPQLNTRATCWSSDVSYLFFFL